jgi:hypothetical protein
VITAVVLSFMSSGVAIYSLTNSVVTGVEQAIARRLISRDE